MIIYTELDKDMEIEICEMVSLDPEDKDPVFNFIFVNEMPNCIIPQYLYEQ